MKSEARKLMDMSEKHKLWDFVESMKSKTQNR